MRALKVVVIAMALLLVAGFALIAYTLATRMGEMTTEEEAPESGFGTRALPVPAGCEIASMALNDDVLVLRLSGPAERGCADILVIDPKNGHLLGRLSPEDGGVERE